MDDGFSEEEIDALLEAVSPPEVNIDELDEAGIAQCLQNFENELAGIKKRALFLEGNIMKLRERQKEGFAPGQVGQQPIIPPEIHGNAGWVVQTKGI